MIKLEKIVLKKSRREGYSATKGWKEHGIKQGTIYEDEILLPGYHIPKITKRVFVNGCSSTTYSGIHLAEFSDVIDNKKTYSFLKAKKLHEWKAMNYNRERTFIQEMQFLNKKEIPIINIKKIESFYIGEFDYDNLRKIFNI